jgi:hypothetical protein
MKMPVPDFAHWKPDKRFSLFVDLEKKMLCYVDYDLADKDAGNWVGTAFTFVSMDGLASGEEIDIFGRKVSILKRWNLIGEPLESKSFAICKNGKWHVFSNRDYEVTLDPIMHPQIKTRIIGCWIIACDRVNKSLLLEISVPRK